MAQQMSDRIMTQGNPLKLLVSFALPLMLGNVFQQLYTVVDTAVVGQVSMDALAALGAVDWFNWMLLGIAQGYTQGFSVRMSQKYGQGDPEGLKQAIGQSAFLSAAFAVICTVLAQLTLPLFFLLLRVPGELAPIAEVYTRIMIGGFPIVMFYNFCASVLRAVGDSKTPLIAMIAASVLNIGLDLAAVELLGWDVPGVAAATLIAQCVAGGICAVKLLRTPILRFTLANMKPQKALSLDLVRLGSPIAAKNTVIALGGMTIQSIVNGFTVSFIAGFTATNKLYGLLEIAALSYGFAITTFVGQNYGAGLMDRIKKGVRSAVFLSLVTAIGIGILMILFGRPITMLFLKDEDPAIVAAAGDTAYQYLCLMAVSLPVLYLLYAFQSALQGMGNTVAPMVSGILEFCLRVSLAIVVAITGFQQGIFGAEVSAWYGAAIFLAISYYRHQRKLEQPHK